jgi:hypothetical protein
MDFSKLFSQAASAVGGLKGAAGLIEKIADMSSVKKAIAQQFGVKPAVLDEFEKEAKEILADGKISREEAEAALGKLAAAKGIPQQAVDMVLTVLKGGTVAQ